MGTPTRKVLKAAKTEPFPWLLLLALLGSIYLFWILPRQIGSPPVRVEFADADR